MGAGELMSYMGDLTTRYDAIAGLGYRGIVLEAFGAGGIHFLRKNLIEKLEALTKAGISVVACRQGMPMR